MGSRGRKITVLRLAQQQKARPNLKSKLKKAKKGGGI
jgi:hypothetical protein